MRNLILIFLVTLCLTANAQEDMAHKQITTVLDYVDKFYVQDVDKDKLAEIAIKSVLKDLDPHSLVEH